MPNTGELVDARSRSSASRSLSDNYIWLVHDADSARDGGGRSGRGAAGARCGRRRAAGRSTQVWNTHWHPDHTGGNAAIKAATGATVTGPAAEARRRSRRSTRRWRRATRSRIGAPRRARCWRCPAIPRGISPSTSPTTACDLHRRHAVRDGLRAAVRGHARARCSPTCSATPRCPTRRASIAAHEYTQSNGRYALAAEPDNAAIARRGWPRSMRCARAGEATVPTTIGAGARDQPVPARRRRVERSPSGARAQGCVPRMKLRIVR